MKKLLTFLTLLTLSIGVTWASTVTLQYSGSTTTNMDGSNQASLVGLSSTDWSVVGAKNDASNNVGLNKDGTIRLYGHATGEGSTLTVSSLKGATINSITITYDSGYNNSYVKVNGSLVVGNEDTYSINNSSFVVGNANTSTAQVRIKTITITFSNGGSPATTYEINYGTTTNGSFDDDNPLEATANSNVTIKTSPNDGYALSNVTVTPTESGVTAPDVTINGDNATFEMPESDVTVDATFAVIPTYSITVNGGGSASPNPAHEGQTVTVSLPDGKMIDTYTSTPEVTLAQDGDNYTFTMPNQAVILNLTLKDKPVQSGRFERITSTDKLEKDARYLLVYESGPYVMGAISTGSTKFGTRVEAEDGFTYQNGVITLDDPTDAKTLTLGGSEGAWTFDMDGSGNYLSWSSGNSLTTSTQVSTNSQWAISFDGNDVIISNVNTPERRIFYNASSPRFACYGLSSSGEYTQSPIQLYKEVTSTTTTPLYLIGENMNSQLGWNLTTGPEFIYSTTAKTYSVDAYFDMADRCFFQFVEGLSNSNSNWEGEDGLTHRYFASSNDGDVPVDWYDGNPLPMDGTHGLNFTDDTQYSPEKYAFSVPAGLYTIVVDKPNWKIYVTQHPVTMTINNNTSGTTYFEDSATATLVSNLTAYEGAKIFYTIDGSDPTNNSTRQEYTAPIPISSNTTVKAIAELNHIKSEVAERTFTKTPKTPVITPNGGTITEATQVTITCETEGASIYYTLDGSTPTNVVSETNFLYSEPFTIDETTTVKARAYVGNTYSNDIATAEFVYTEPYVPGEGDFVRVTSKDDLVAGREYIIVTADYNWAMGAISTDDKRAAAASKDFDFDISTDHSTVTLTENSTVNVMKLENGRVYPSDDTKYWNLKQENGQYVYLNNSGTQISQSAQTYLSGYSKELIINITAGTNENNYAIITEGGNSQILYSRGSNNTAGYFRYYSNANQNNSAYSRVFLYYREGATVPPTEATLAVIESAQGVKDTKYAIADDYLVAVDSRNVKVDDVDYIYVWCKDDNNVANPLAPANEDIIDIMKKDSEAQGNRPWDQSNWVVLRFKDDGTVPTDLKGKKITGIVGTYVDDINYMIDVESYEKGTSASYTPNVYCVANFNPANWGANGVQQPNAAANAPYYFFMTPKVQEVCEITYAEWNGTALAFTVPASSGFAKNTLTLGWEYNVLESGPVSQQAAEAYLNDNNEPDENGNLPVYHFRAVVQNNPSKGAVSGENKVYPMNFKGESNIVTAINTIEVGNGQVKSVKYVNVAGIVSDVPFQGVNIVVTEYTDGSRTTSKMLRK